MVNDLSIITGIITVFLLLGVCLPYINASFGVSASDIDIDEFESGASEDVPETIDPLTFFDVIISIGKMFTWTWGALPWWLDIIFLSMRLTLLIFIARMIRGQ